MKMKNLSTLAFLLFILFIMTSLKLFQTPDGPHGGRIKESGNYYIEMKNQHEEFYAFLLSKNFIALSNKGVSCSTRFFLADGTNTDVRLKPFETDGFKLSAITPKFSSCRITFSVLGKSVSATFDNMELLVKKK